MSGWKTWRGPQAREAANRALRAGLHLAGEVLLEQAQAEVPHDEGTLMRSGTVIDAPGDVPEVAISFGGGPGTGHPIVPYAVRWHENSAQFQKGRKKRYLADPVNRHGRDVVTKSIAYEAGRAFR